MEAWKEAELLNRIRQAIFDEFPLPLRDALLETIGRWYGWASRNDPAPELGPPCRICGRLLPARRGICRLCLKTAQRLAREPDWPLRDMALAYAVRALRDDPKAASFLERLASRYPDLRRFEPPCRGCGRARPAVGTENFRLCLDCLDRAAD